MKYNIEEDRKILACKVKKYVEIIEEEYKYIMPEYAKTYLHSVRDYNDIVVIEDTGTISLFATARNILLPLDAYKVMNAMSKVLGFGVNKKHTTYNRDTMILNQNTFKDFIQHVFIAGLSPREYFEEILLHETMHLCGGNGADALSEGINELKTRELAQKYNLKTSCCGYPKEVEIAYKLQEIFGKEVMDKIEFAALGDIYLILCNEVGESAANPMLLT